MLSERMARAACFRSQNVMAEAHEAMWDAARRSFSTALAGLRDGNTTLEIRAEDRPDVLEALSSVDRVWPGYEAALSRAREDTASLPEVAMRSLSTVKAANDVVQALEASNAGSGVSPELARLINVAGRQRMLTQRAAKEFCLIAAGIEPETLRASLAVTVALFDRSLEGLMNGDEEMGLVAFPDPDLQLQLEYVRDLWAPMRAQFLRVIDGGTPGSIALNEVAANIDGVLGAADEAVWLYENI
ncbi:hypothetical protein ATO3_01890 [Marinibacterium profundimaris]|uniref:NarX-like N-terminal domain-containing protein n=2 Tax=Marinibacterium profundimaris TaxID=1679460 RepID=A0A225NT23_9RHOB|nr:hypothetical protein ATO3_01890 [Marinibacterium profundimaris]